MTRRGSNVEGVCIAFDIGGTFTDFVLRRADGRIAVLKLPTTPDDPARAVLVGVDRLLAADHASSAAIGELMHATTVATNAIIERKGARTALVTTRGFRDVLIIGRQKRYETYDLHLDKPIPLVRRRDIREITERIDPAGKVVTGLSTSELDALARQIVAEDYDALAICLLHAYANPSHERAVARALARAHPTLKISLSSEVSPKAREYERTSTTVANAYVQPIVDRYIGNLEHHFRAMGAAAPLSIMQSNGGLTSAGLARKFPVRIVESGPAAGVLLCAQIGRALRLPRLLTFDMGGTTAKLGAVDDAEPAVTATYEVDTVEYRKGSGLPLNVPSVELLEIGAGGGSIATVDMGLIRVGPQSAGSVPGPMCYGQGGARATVTDANLVLGYIDADNFNAGAMRLDRGAALAGIESQIARPLGLSAVRAAWGVHALANSNMERAMRTVSIERGRDPREYVLVAFGGAGPLHAARLARALSIPQVVVPRGAGVGSAIGMLDADLKVDASLTRSIVLVPEAYRAIAAVVTRLHTRIARDLAQLGGHGKIRYTRFAYMRYRGQGFEIRVDLPDAPIDRRYVERCVQAFRAQYAKTYGYQDPTAVIEALDWYLVASRPRASAPPPIAPASTNVRVPPRTRAAYFPEYGRSTACRVVRRAALTSRMRVRGPALIDEDETTTVLLPGDSAKVTESGHLLITIAKARR